jgi:hypothetical protein
VYAISSDLSKEATPDTAAAVYRADEPAAKDSPHQGGAGRDVRDVRDVRASMSTLIDKVFRSTSTFRATRGGDGGVAPWEAHIHAPQNETQYHKKECVRRGSLKKGEDHVRIVKTNGRDERNVCEPASGGASISGVRANARRVLVCVPLDDQSQLVETRDLFDRAHTVTALMGRHEVGVAPAARQVGRGARARVIDNVQGARPRLYPRHQMTSQGVAFDSAFDGTHEIQEWMRREGLTTTEAKADVLAERARAASVLGPMRFKVRTRQATRQ